MMTQDAFCTLTMTRAVAAPRLRLFDFLIDFRNEMRFGHSIRQCRVESASPPGPRQRIGEGTTFAFDYNFFGVRMSTVFVIEDVADGERFTARQLRGGIPFRLQYVFADDGPGCRVTTHTHLLDRGWAHLLRKPLAVLVDRDMNKYMDLLAAYFAREAARNQQPRSIGATEVQFPPTGRLPPLARRLPIAGSLPMLLKDPLAFTLAARQTHGDIYLLDVGFTEFAILNHPRHAHYVLREHASNFRKSGPFWDMARTILGDSLVTTEGEPWRRRRRMMNPQFHRQRLEIITGRMAELIRDGMAAWEQQGEARPVDLAKEFSRLVLQVTVGTIFGSSLNRAEMDTAAADVKYIFDHFLFGMPFTALPSWLPVPGRRRFEAAISGLDRVVSQAIEKAERKGGAADSLIAQLVDLVDTESSERMTARQLRDEAVGLFLGGFETTATALAWAAQVLVENPEWTRRLRVEVDEVLGDREPGFLDLARLKNTLAVIQEVLRLYPPGYWIPRTTVEDDHIDGWRIPAGTVVMPFVYAIHRHPDYWPEPDRFDPTRFLIDESQARTHAFLPFGLGQRQCIGKDFTLLESQLLLARLMQHYELVAVPGQKSEPAMRLSLTPKHGVKVCLRKRRDDQRSNQ